MKYFTKYLPVEGEIKEGDTALNNHGNPFTVTIAYSKEQVLALNNNPHFKKVKLFLCSRDIQLGDIVFNKYYSEYQWPAGKILNTNSEVMDAGMLSGGEPDHTTDYKYPEGEWEYHHQTYKVIGEVSPNAIWVKEGMEFENEELIVHVDEYNRFTIPVWLAHLRFVGGKDKEKPYTIQFKCFTCNTFH